MFCMFPSASNCAIAGFITYYYCSAGAVSIVKSVKLPELQSPDMCKSPPASSVPRSLLAQTVS